MPNSKVIQAELTAGRIDVTVQLSLIEPGERVIVQTTVSQGDAQITLTEIVTSEVRTEKHRVRLSALLPADGSGFEPGEPLAANTLATTVWPTRLLPMAGEPPKQYWVSADPDGY